MAFSAKFEDNTRYKLGYLTKQSVIWAVVGVDFGQQFSPVQLVKDSDRMFVIGKGDVLWSAHAGKQCRWAATVCRQVLSNKTWQLSGKFRPVWHHVHSIMFDQLAAVCLPLCHSISQLQPSW